MFLAPCDRLAVTMTAASPVQAHGNGKREEDCRHHVVFGE